jgi:phosphotransferase system  glucose/maltose/N-acetylglucosamine-specific IIC component
MILITIGVGIPLLALIVTFPVYGLFYPSDQYLFTTGPVIILAVWALPLIGGIYALRRKKWGLVLAGSITALCYIVPFAIVLEDLIGKISQSSFIPMIILFCLLLLITIAAIPATAFIAMSKKEFE